MEDGLRFALHRLLDLKQMQYEYLKNPYYQPFSNAKLQEFCNEDPKSIQQHILKLIESLLQQEQSEINTKLYYEKVGKSFDHVYNQWENLDSKVEVIQADAIKPEYLSSEVCDRHHGHFGY